MNEKNVHTEHCCVEHGCKYNDFDCPVWLGQQRQSYTCESCNFDFNTGFDLYLPNSKLPTVSNDVLLKRRLLAKDNFPDI